VKETKKSPPKAGLCRVDEKRSLTSGGPIYSGALSARKEGERHLRIDARRPAARAAAELVKGA
jgi:hypothetical protein